MQRKDPMKTTDTMVSPCIDPEARHAGQLDAFGRAIQALCHLEDRLGDGDSRRPEVGGFRDHLVERLVWQLGIAGLLEGAVLYDRDGDASESIVRVEASGLGRVSVIGSAGGIYDLSALARYVGRDRAVYIGLSGTKERGMDALAELATSRAAHGI
jgi:hypothetical protein